MKGKNLALKNSSVKKETIFLFPSVYLSQSYFSACEFVQAFKYQ